QAEDGIRDYKVTGVQTCALPIWCQAVLAELGATDSLPVRASAEASEEALLPKSLEPAAVAREERELTPAKFPNKSRIITISRGEIGRASCRERVWDTVQAVSSTK